MYKIYRTEEFTTIIFDDPNGIIWSIPVANDNRRYQEYLAWVAEGNTAEEYISE